MPLRNLVAGLVLCAVTVAYASLIGSIPDRTLPNTPGPSFMPWLIAAVMGILSLCLVIQAARELLRIAGADDPALDIEYRFAGQFSRSYPDGDRDRHPRRGG